MWETFQNWHDHLFFFGASLTGIGGGLTGIGRGRATGLGAILAHIP